MDLNKDVREILDWHYGGNFEKKKLVSELIIKKVKEQLRIGGVHDTLPADELIRSLGEASEPNEYILKTDNGVWWIEHKHVGSGEPLKQWLTDKPISG